MYIIYTYLLNVIDKLKVIYCFHPAEEICLEYFAASKNIKMFVLDEADEMLSRGFKDQIYEIFQKLSSNIQVRRPSVFLN